MRPGPDRATAGAQVSAGPPGDLSESVLVHLVDVDAAGDEAATARFLPLEEAHHATADALALGRLSLSPFSPPRTTRALCCRTTRHRLAKARCFSTGSFWSSHC